MKIYTDGSYSIRNSTGGWACVFVVNGKVVKTKYEKIKKSTSNRAEMFALIHALKQDSGEITIYSDSKYCVNGYNSWMYSWQRNNWSKKNGKLKNADLWKEVFKLKSKSKKVVWIRSHSGNEFNELADKIAKQ